MKRNPTESMPGDTDTGHGGVTPTVRRKGAEYARDLLIAAAARDGADQTPHQVWGTARADWALTRLAASGEFINYSPFTGTRMGDIMAEREAQRAERFSEFFTLTQIPPRKKQTLTPQPESPGKSAVQVGSSPRNPVREAEKAVTVLEEQRRVVAQQYRQIGEHLGQVQGQEHQICQQLEQITRQITQAQQARDGRGWLAKMLKPNEGAQQIEQWSKQQAGLERERVQVTQQREGLERDLAQVSQQYQDIDGQYQRAQLYRDGVKAEQIAERASKNDLTNVLGRSRSRPGRGISGAPQFGVNRGHQRDNDQGRGL